MKSNITLSVDHDLIRKMKELGINLSHFFEQQAMLMFNEKEMYIEVSKRGSKIYQEIKYLKKDVLHAVSEKAALSATNDAYVATGEGDENGN